MQQHVYVRPQPFAPWTFTDPGAQLCGYIRRKVEIFMLRKEQKTAIIDANRTHEGDTGSPEVQVAILTERINVLTEHMRNNTGRYALYRPCHGL